MDLSPGRLMRSLAKAAPEDQRRIIYNMTVADLLSHDGDFEGWAHKSQLPPKKAGWRTWLMLAGRGFGKTRAGAEWIEKIARSRPGARIALAGATIDEGRRVMVEGVSGILAVAKRRRHRVKWEPSLGRLRWPNGSEAQLFSGDNPDGLRGPEHDFAWCAANLRHRRRRRSGGTGTRRSTCLANCRCLLPRRAEPDWGLAGLCRPPCRVQHRRMEVCRAGAWPCRSREDDRDAGELRLCRLGYRHGSRLAAGSER